jgi:uncharacterized protein YkwD
MDKCNYCGKKTDRLPHKCKYCGQIHCTNHLLPESHNRIGLEEHKKRSQERWKNVFTNSTDYKSKKIKEDVKSKKIRHKSYNKKKNIQGRIKNYFITQYEDLIYWLKKREHYKYNFERRANYLITTILIFVAPIVGFSIFYSNATKLNGIELWIIKLGGVLILISLFFAIKFGWRLGKEGINILKRQRNWLKYLVIILIILLLWQGYTNRDNILNPAFDTYNKTNFSLFTPISLGNFSFEIDSDSGSSSSSNSGRGWLGGGSNRDINLIEQEILVLVNEERQRSGARTLISKTHLDSFARSWSNKMISQNFFEHSNLNFAYPSIAGENIGETPIHYDVKGCGSTYSNSQMAKCFVDGWIGSPGHHENMIDKRFSMSGVGVSCDSSKCRATQVFSG